MDCSQFVEAGKLVLVAMTAEGVSGEEGCGTGVLLCRSERRGRVPPVTKAVRLSLLKRWCMRLRRTDASQGDRKGAAYTDQHRALRRTAQWRKANTMQSLCPTRNSIALSQKPLGTHTISVVDDESDHASGVEFCGLHGFPPEVCHGASHMKSLHHRFGPCTASKGRGSPLATVPWATGVSTTVCDRPPHQRPVRPLPLHR